MSTCCDRMTSHPVIGASRRKAAVAGLGEPWLGKRLETKGHAANDALWRSDGEQFVVKGLIDAGVPEEVADGDEHLPLGAVEVEEWQRLADLDVEPVVDARRGLALFGSADVPVPDAIKHQHAC